MSRPLCKMAALGFIANVSARGRKRPRAPLVTLGLVVALCFLTTGNTCRRPGGMGARGAAEQAKTQAKAGDFERTLEHDGLQRSYLIHVPSSYNGSRPVPLVLSFHGRLGTGRAQMELTHMNELADREQFIVVYPNGIGRSWNAGHETGPAARREVDDVGFASRLIDVVSDDYRIDRKRVYAAGMSNGAVLAHRLACELSDKVAAVAAVAATIATAVNERCRPRRPISVIQFYGTADTYARPEGGETVGGGKVSSVNATVAGWVAQDRCPASPRVTLKQEDAVCETYGPCQGGTEVSVCRVEGGGHTWPGGEQYLPRAVVGKTSESLNATEVMWDFFTKHPLP